MESETEIGYIERLGWNCKAIKQKWTNTPSCKDATVLVYFLFSSHEDAEGAKAECSSYGWQTTYISGEKHFRFTALVPITTESFSSCWYNSNEGAWLSVAERHDGKVEKWNILRS